MSYLTYPAQFNGISLLTISGLTVLTTNPYEIPNRTLSIANLTNTNTSTVSSAFYTSRTITIRVGISRSSRELVEQSLDNLMTVLQGKEKELILNQAMTQRKYYCTLSDVVTSLSGGSYLELDLVFTCSDSFGYDTTSTPLVTVTGHTTSYKSNSIVVDGSAPWQQPVITLTYTVGPGAGSASVIIDNPDNGQTITITRTAWTTADVLEIDSYNKTVKVNGVEVEYSGAIPEWSPGNGYLVYSDNLASRTVNISVSYVKRWV